ncbi:hypothetical protein PF002_g18304 [Phytophthora fragariae]|uniref:Secreted protein n=1 Tax=Phytophthora fragariae TaxID=53985 RepID=A0A6A3Y4W7_9STRA|nr:hypothetical protein PF009_g13792 [Phytophthora fragariae]KAE9108165.1 hypothetical protein PF007_g12758 [Phytophthora fragariae]KAE9212255.1 hypothetical protein PF002_g18304 [Phytophthora fragariae]KAE9226642.1 hypothetical protein PF004_g11584 [Phytophthora fragariae]KAE9306779.1 hypothetical protein PF001_g11945 [Phytophthora fragariae]
MRSSTAPRSLAWRILLKCFHCVACSDSELVGGAPQLGRELRSELSISRSAGRNRCAAASSTRN